MIWNSIIYHRNLPDQHRSTTASPTVRQLTQARYPSRHNPICHAAASADHASRYRARSWKSSGGVSSPISSCASPWRNSASPLDVLSVVGCLPALQPRGTGQPSIPPQRSSEPLADQDPRSDHHRRAGGAGTQFTRVSSPNQNTGVDYFKNLLLKRW